MSKILIIAEAGVNHNGDIEKALQLIDVAADAGADVVKFQTFKAETLVTKSAAMAEYQKKNLNETGSQFAMLKKLELKPEDHAVLIERCRQRGIRFLSTGFDLESLKFLATLKMGLWKIPSGEITNLPYLEFIGRQGDDLILSTGMSTLDEVKTAVEILRNAGANPNRLTVLHCTTEYPTPMDDVNLKAMKTIREATGCQIGYSDHTQGIEVSIAAAALGAAVIEKHFTLDRNLPGPDHRASLEPSELKALVSGVRNVEKALGSAKKVASASEQKNIAIARKSIVTQQLIRRGDLFTAENLTTKRPGTGLSPMKWYEVLGRKASRDFAEDEILNEGDLS